MTFFPPLVVFLQPKMADNSRATTSTVGQLPTNTAVKVTASTAKTTTSSLKEADSKQKSGGSSLADFLLHLDDYTPTVCIVCHVHD